MRYIKKALDFKAALILLLMSLPFWVLIIVAIKLESRGPVFINQNRIGKDGKVFRLLKFRSMVKDAEVNGPIWSSAEDDRSTRVGRFLRRFHLDELPQFFNVLKGEMSFVGPRPERPEFAEKILQALPEFIQRNQVTPGLTGWAQVNMPADPPFSESKTKLEFDIYYIEHWNIWLDFIILVKTVGRIISGK